MDNPLFLFIGALLQPEAVAAMILILMVVILLLCGSPQLQDSSVAQIREIGPSRESDAQQSV